MFLRKTKSTKAIQLCKQAAKTLRALEEHGDLGDETLIQMSGRLAVILEGASVLPGLRVAGGTEKARWQGADTSLHDDSHSPAC